MWKRWKWTGRDTRPKRLENGDDCGGRNPYGIVKPKTNKAYSLRSDGCWTSYERKRETERIMRAIYTEIRVNEATASEVEESEKKKKKKKPLRPCAAGRPTRGEGIVVAHIFTRCHVQPVARTANYVFGSALSVAPRSPYTVYCVQTHASRRRRRRVSHRRV